jgi:2-hydroxychromene-2-carboxylate isomerase
VSRQATLYFDFISPFGYLYFKMLDRLPAEIELEFKPVLFAGLLKHWEHKGPAEIPGKRKFTYRFVQWKAAELDPRSNWEDFRFCLERGRRRC